MHWALKPKLENWRTEFSKLKAGRLHWEGVVFVLLRASNFFSFRAVWPMLCPVHLLASLCFLKLASTRDVDRQCSKIVVAVAYRLHIREPGNLETPAKKRGAMRQM